MIRQPIHHFTSRYLLVYIYGGVTLQGITLVKCRPDEAVLVTDEVDEVIKA